MHGLSKLCLGFSVIISILFDKNVIKPVKTGHRKTQLWRPTEISAWQNHGIYQLLTISFFNVLLIDKLCIWCDCFGLSRSLSFAWLFLPLENVNSNEWTCELYRNIAINICFVSLTWLESWFYWAIRKR